jgi:hypothetical protein
MAWTHRLLLPRPDRCYRVVLDLISRVLLSVLLQSLFWHTLI